MEKEYQIVDGMSTSYASDFTPLIEVLGADRVRELKRQNAEDLARFQTALMDMPPSGGGGFNPNLPAVFRAAKNAGIPAEVAKSLVKAFATGDRAIQKRELARAAHKIYVAEPCSGFTGFEHIPHEGAGERRPAVSLDLSAVSFSGTEADLIERSPLPPAADPGDQMIQALRAAYRPGEHVFCGGREAAKPGKNLCQVADFLDLPPHAEQITCNPLTGKRARTQEGKLSYNADAATADHRYLVLEFDSQPLPWQAAFYAWLLDQGAPIRWLCHSGGKSIHALIHIGARDAGEYREAVSQLRPYLKALGADTGCLHAGRLTRLPGGYRAEKGRHQHLLYLDDRPLPTWDKFLHILESLPQRQNLRDDAPAPLPGELTPVPAFDYELLPDALRPWVQDIADRLQCPPEYVAVSVMVALGSLVGRQVGIRPQAETDWTVTANLWGLVVGRPGEMKSPAQEQAMAPMRQLSAQAVEEYKRALADFQTASKAAELRSKASEKAAAEKLKQNPQADVAALLVDDSPEEPKLRRYVVNDSTPAALGALHVDNPNGLLAFRDEVVSLLKGLDKEENAEGRGFYLTGWNGDSAYTFDRIGRGMNLHIPAVCLSLLGGTQPGRLSEYVRHAVKGGAGDDGLLQRFGLLVWPDSPGRWRDVDRPPDREARKAAFDVFHRLAEIDLFEIEDEQDLSFDGQPEGLPFLRFSPDALALFRTWRAELEHRLRSDDLHPALESHLAKYRKLVPALALISHLADHGTGPVTAAATRRALNWAEFLEPHAHRAYSSLTQAPVAAAKAIIAKIKSKALPPEFTARDIQRKQWSRLSDREQILAALALLVDYGWLEQERIETAGAPKIIFIAHHSITPAA